MSDGTIVRLTYVSRHDFDCDGHGFHPAFTTIEQVAVLTNATLDITGFLICARSWFAQIIEGPADSIGKLYEAIARDPRHHDVRLIEQGPADRRLFPDWHMAIGIASPAAIMVFATLDFSERNAPENRSAQDLHELATDLAALRRLADG
ncbi:BLUF domain-containing protein [Phreatobacter sp.]|uniref:BLUF domain-containing protein n=1 Tax=Phreatobacter sp. TaxID=1966341 RepID=UPI003F70E6B3